ncbi:peptidoglycan-binding protein LysM [Flavobacteriales bacterium]|nr:peptidoglycan-binding protein LysM [Flavobacteriales bacterium]
MTFKFKLISFTLLFFTIGKTLPPPNLNYNVDYITTLVLSPSNGYDFDKIAYKIPFTTRDFVGFKEFLGFYESGSDYKKINSLGYLGKYQFGRSTLKVLRIKKINNFINIPELQEKAFLMNVMRNKWILRREIERFSGKKINNILITESGIIAAAHLSGPGNVKKFLRNNCNNNLDFKDINGTKISDYIKIFRNYDISNILAIRKPYIN